MKELENVMSQLEKETKKKRTGGKQNQATKTKEITAKKKGGHETKSRKRRRV